MRRLVRFQGQLIVRIRDLRSRPIRAEKHADGHVLIPERHGFTKYAKLQAPDGAKVCRRSESVRARADDHYIKDRHFIGTSFGNSLSSPADLMQQLTEVLRN